MLDLSEFAAWIAVADVTATIEIAVPALEVEDIEHPAQPIVVRIAGHGGVENAIRDGKRQLRITLDDWSVVP